MAIKGKYKSGLKVLLGLVLLLGAGGTAYAANAPVTSEAVRIALTIALLTLLPALLMVTTSFIRIIVVLSIIRHALGMPETPPNQVLVGLAVFFTAFVMAPTMSAVNDRALTPFLDGTMTVTEAAEQGAEPMKAFMLRQVRDTDLQRVYAMADKPLPDSAAEVEMMQLIPAFMLNELRVAFQIGFVILLPFLLIDLVVSSVLLALGMLMVPPATISLPIKILMFVLIDGWSLIMQGVIAGIQ